MGLLGRLLSYSYRVVNGFNIGDVKTDPGGGENRTAQHFQPANIAGRPLPDDVAALLPVPGAGRVVAVAFGDPSAPDDLEPGELLLYARDDTGARVLSVKLANDGALTARNADGGELLLNPNGSGRLGNSNGGIIIDAGGQVTINGFTIDTSGNVSTTGSGEFGTGEFGTSLRVGGKELNNHTHSGVTTGGGISGPNI